MEKQKKKGFTIVELIVVITIIAILGTIAFISLSSYTALARNAIRLDAISKVATVVENKTLGGIGILAFVDSGQEVPGAEIGGEITSIGINYKAGTINTSVLELKSTDFSDPTNGQLFSMGATTKKGGQYEVIATLEDGGTQRSQISGNYEPRESELISGVGLLGEKKFVLTSANDLNKFYRGDIVTGTGVVLGSEIESISADGLTLILSNQFTSNANEIQIGSSEINGMVISIDGINPVTNGSNFVAYSVAPSINP